MTDYRIGTRCPWGPGAGRPDLSFNRGKSPRIKRYILNHHCVRKDTAPAIKHPQKKEAININVIIIERLIQIVFIL